MEVEQKSFPIVEKVQNHHKDVSVPLVTEIQSMPPKDLPVEVFPVEPPQPKEAPQEVPVVEKEVVSKIQETINVNKRTPAKLTNRLIVAKDVHQLIGTPIKGDAFKAPLPKRIKPKVAPEPPAKKKEIIPTFALRIHAKEMLKEIDDIVLPSKLQLIFEFFSEIDNAINS